MNTGARGLLSQYDDIWLVDGVRTPFAEYNTALGLVSPIDLGIKVAREIFRRSGVSPEAALGGPIGAVRDGDMINFDVKKRVLEVEISDDVLGERMSQWKAPKPRYPTGVFAKYGALVWSASQGAITTPR